jgi:hypothetical protein
MMSDLIPFNFTDVAALVIFSNHSSTLTSHAQFYGLMHGREEHQTCFFPDVGGRRTFDEEVLNCFKVFMTQ